MMIRIAIVAAATLAITACKFGSSESSVVKEVDLSKKLTKTQIDKRHKSGKTITVAEFKASWAAGEIGPENYKAFVFYFGNSQTCPGCIKYMPYVYKNLARASGSDYIVINADLKESAPSSVDANELADQWGVSTIPFVAVWAGGPKKVGETNLHSPKDETDQERFLRYKKVVDKFIQENENTN